MFNDLLEHCILSILFLKLPLFLEDGVDDDDDDDNVDDGDDNDNDNDNEELLLLVELILHLILYILIALKYDIIIIDNDFLSIHILIHIIPYS